MLKEFDMKIDEHKFLDLWTLELGLEEITFMSGTRFDCDEESIGHHHQHLQGQQHQLGLRSGTSEQQYSCQD